MNSLGEKRLYLAIDPGKDKCGIALVYSDSTPVLLDIILRNRLDTYLKKLFHKYNIEIILLGNGTHSEKIKKMIKKHDFSPIVLVDEENTTFQAEKRYREEHPLKGFKRILNIFASWTPSRDVDDYAALIIAEKYLKNR